MGRACGTAGPRTSPSDARENVPSEKPTNTNPIHRGGPAGRPVGSACGFLSPSDAGQVRLESAVRALLGAAVFASSIPYLDVSADSLAARGRGRRGSRFVKRQLMMARAPLSAHQNEAIRAAIEAKHC